MLEYLTPTWMVTSIYRITPDQLKREGIQAILTDLDNTLVEWHTKEASEQLLNWVRLMKESGIKVVVVSNNSGGRVKKITDEMQVPFISRAKKPSRRGILRALDLLDLKKEQVVMVGDQLLTDVLSGNRSGVRTIWVKQMSESDEWKTWANRMIERQLVVPLLKRKMKLEWRDTINDDTSK
ncbi:YqeG family HAD IIIA-type phosphatase [Atopobacter sp. AH10]|uniref:YqeG family HAD IIIA-type phosphatase n=1 Tax=Atopobacter sp. AH10 TaxID=2315861 RepID=UPI000EF1A9FF|nr:YqeG family HAD IIIA-type phosphatase [Atopobacter sp. AH10]RLK62924.1 YqeG family HAD IIIA-type phosphatase [Atopobacter sp. AH10]